MAKFRNTITHLDTVGGGDITFRSKLEARWSKYLDFLLEHDEIQAWDYECKVFEFEEIRHGTTRYLPDFRVTESDGSITWHEVKGVLLQKSITKLRRMHKYYPDETIWLIFDGVHAGKSKSAQKQQLAIGKLQNRIGRIVDAKPIFKQLGI